MAVACFAGASGHYSGAQRRVWRALLRCFSKVSFAVVQCTHSTTTTTVAALSLGCMICKNMAEKD